MPSDLEQLLEMGFDKARAELAVKKSGGREQSQPSPQAVSRDSFTDKPPL